MRENVILECSVCHSRNYTISKKKEDKSKRMEVTKFCPKCNAHTLHKETR
ncbi:MAG: 50S ribosomal protein L33 [Bacilli bacterium]|nr:50S ribosomal protein L33 [Bacilli bacterium]MCI7622618.1 50S ribosomal protein L33 [Bacilli bacterium]MDD6227354.1 50S ribosomal protein L33 [Bacilli bacterium]MDD7375423.1 50S ribosomal protein L33 [Bacilli bacterium]MDD7549683.1 50S ribosomal protein L33 [Bacilli bacterium]